MHDKQRNEIDTRKRLTGIAFFDGLDVATVILIVGFFVGLFVFLWVCLVLLSDF
jgi:hypothetical protein